MSKQYTIEQLLTLAKNVLDKVEIAFSPNKQQDVILAKQNINNALTNIEKEQLQALVEYTMTIENLLSSEEDFASYVKILDK